MFRMATFFNRFSDIRNYRLASVALIAATILLPVVAMRLGAWEWTGLLAGVAAYVALVVLTYHRHRDACLSGMWIMVMIVQVRLGPSWDGLEPLRFYPTDILPLIPVALGWLVRAPQTVAPTRALPDGLNPG